MPGRAHGRPPARRPPRSLGRGAREAEALPAGPGLVSTSGLPAPGSPASGARPGFCLCSEVNWNRERKLWFGLKLQFQASWEQVV